MNHIMLGVIVFLGVGGLILLTMAVGSYNGLVSLKNQVDRAWANIDVILKQRFDLIPRLISVCEQFAQYERGTFDKIIEARKSYGAAQNVNDKIKASAEMNQALKGVFALGEAYPVLKSSEQFVELQKTTRDLESQIADRRELFNECVTNFNTRCHQIPDMFFAQMLGYTDLTLYHVDKSETVAPDFKMKLPA